MDMKLQCLRPSKSLCENDKEITTFIAEELPPFIDQRISDMETQSVSPVERKGSQVIPNEAYVGRLNRRMEMIEEIRTAYLRDVICLKELITELLTDDERSVLLSQWKETIPSLDLTQPFMLKAPTEASLSLIPCDKCGGSVEIVHHDCKELARVKVALAEIEESTSNLKAKLQLEIATKTAQIETLQSQVVKLQADHKVEKEYMFSEMRELKLLNETLRHRNDELHTNNQALRAEKSSLEEEGAKAEANATHLKEAEEACERLTKEVLEARRLERAAETQVRELQAELSSLAPEREENQRQRAELANKLDESIADVERLSKLEKSHRASIDTLEKRSKKLQRLLDTSVRNCRALQDHKAELAEKCDSLEGRLESSAKSLCEELDRAKVESASHKKSLEDLTKSNESVIQSLNECKSLLSMALYEKDHLTQRNAAIIAEMETLAKAKDEELQQVKITLNYKSQYVAELEQDLAATRESVTMHERRYEELQEEICEVNRLMRSCEERVEAAVEKCTEAEERARKFEEECAKAVESAKELQRVMDEKAARRSILKMKTLQRRNQRSSAIESPTLACQTDQCEASTTLVRRTTRPIRLTRRISISEDDGDVGRTRFSPIAKNCHSPNKLRSPSGVTMLREFNASRDSKNSDIALPAI